MELNTEAVQWTRFFTVTWCRLSGGITVVTSLFRFTYISHGWRITDMLLEFSTWFLCLAYICSDETESQPTAAPGRLKLPVVAHLGSVKRSWNWMAFKKPSSLFSPFAPWDFQSRSIYLSSACLHIHPLVGRTRSSLNCQSVICILCERIVTLRNCRSGPGPPAPQGKKVHNPLFSLCIRRRRRIHGLILRWAKRQWAQGVLFIEGYSNENGITVKRFSSRDGGREGERRR